MTAPKREGAGKRERERMKGREKKRKGKEKREKEKKKEKEKERERTTVTMTHKHQPAVGTRWIRLTSLRGRRALLYRADLGDIRCILLTICLQW